LFKGAKVVGLELKVLGDWIIFEDLKDSSKAWVVVVGIRGQCGREDKNCLKDFDGLFIL